MGVNMIKRSVGRPKTLSREHVINTAFGEYWLHGINNVPVSKVALSSGVSRPGIYIEFKNEDTLKSEVLKKYIDESAEPVHKNYDNLDYNEYNNFNSIELMGHKKDSNRYCFMYFVNNTSFLSKSYKTKSENNITKVEENIRKWYNICL